MESLIKVQKNLKSSIEKAFINYKKSPKDRLTREYIEIRLENMERDWSSFRANNTTLIEIALPDVLDASDYVKSNLYEVTEEIFIEYKTVMKTCLNKLNAQTMVTPLNPNNSSKTSISSVKLPKITIPNFSGKYSEWPTFRDLFISLIHNNESLDNVQKLHYLKSHVTESANGLKDLLDTTTDCLNALQNLDVNVGSWDVIIIYIVTSKLDNETRKQWELNVSSDSSKDLPTLKQFKEFMECRFRALECLSYKGLGQQTSGPSNQQFRINSPSQQAKVFVTAGAKNLCEYCSEEHKLCFCKKFAKLSYDQRHEFVSVNRICFNCLGSNHSVAKCEKPTSCRICKKRHHSLLHPHVNSVHIGQIEDESQADANSSSEDCNSPLDSANEITACLSTGKAPKTGQVLLATALVRAQSRSGEYQMIRALLDQGSQASFITEDTVQYLRLKKQPVRGVISGIGGSGSMMSKAIVNVNLQSPTDPNFEIEVKAYVLQNITSYLPDRKILVDWVELKNVKLADPQYNSPNKINILLGAEVYSQVLKEGVIKPSSGNLIAQCTTFGWILSGLVTSEEFTNKSPRINVMHAQINEDDILKRFWEMEEQVDKTKRILNENEQRCEEIFRSTTQRTDDGRYVVKLPFGKDESLCKGGNSRQIAVKRLKGLERKLSKDHNLKESYTKVLKEYIALDHMRLVMNDDDKKEDSTYLPHHAVVREDKSTTKVRTVFDASSKNEKGFSLNDCLLVGPTLQSDLRHILLQWRIFPIGLVADVIKMYRQVRIADSDTIYQRIVWRDSPEKEISDYELLTLTFGTASAPYLAVKAMQQIAHDEGTKYPLAKERVLRSFYMDDLMTGCEDVKEGMEIYKEMTKLLAKGGFELQKWNSNSNELLKQISRTCHLYQENDEEKFKMDTENMHDMEIELDKTIKVLGLTWKRDDDYFKYYVQLPTKSGPETKRTALSDIARLFDPLGWAAPSVVIAKIFIQKLWLAGIQWDEAIPDQLLQEWRTYRNEISELANIRIPRWLGTKADDLTLELHGFSDASKMAYSAVVYVRVINSEGNVKVNLLTARTKVAPIKQRSIPRLELCGAWLLAQLLEEVVEILKIPKTNVRAWTDSTIVLSWLNKHPSHWKTFVANRVSDILSKLDAYQWSHISSKDNPADCASRGIAPSELVNNKLWLSGPRFLANNTIFYEKPKNLDITLEQAVKVHIAVVENIFWERFSSLSRLLRVVSYCKRFKNYKRGKSHFEYLKKDEIDGALETCIKMSQREGFHRELIEIKEKGMIRMKDSKIKSLTPHIDERGMLRVGGRLQGSSLDEHTKHPIILSKDSHLTQLLIADAHEKTFHGGRQLMTNYLRTAYWILGVKHLIKTYIHNCVTCIRYQAKINNQLMGSLPSVRVTPARPFYHSGVDFAGPISIRTTKGRGYRSYKGYICLFVCMVTRAVHLEAVSDMTTQGFIAAYRRFVARRGHCAQLWSDNGTNFVGAAKELKELWTIQQSIIEHLEINGTKWNFIPPHAPNFGGLWEAGVKSTKFHLKRVIGDSTLTFEEMITLLSQVEACLNSRPMTLVNDTDPDEPTPLTPGHFLVGGPLISVPDVNYELSNCSSLSRWQLVQKMLQHFWRRWSSEYLVTLLHRYKWTKQIPEPQIGDVVLVKEDDLPPSRWLMARVIEKHPGADCITRVVTLRTKTSILKRPTSKLCILPISRSDSD